METQVEKKNNYQLELSVSVPRERWQTILDEAFEAYRKSVKMDGFRRGKVPLSMVKRMFGEAIESEAAEEAVQTFYREAVDKEDINAIAPAEISEVDFGADKPFTFKALIEIMPEIKAEGLDKMRTHIDRIELSGEDVDAGIEVLREEYAIISSHSGAIEEGCIVKTDVQEVDRTGVPVLTHKWPDITLEIGKGSFGAEVDEKLKGKKEGESVMVALPTGEKDEKGRDQITHYKFEIREVQTKELPEVNDEFAKSISEEFENTEDLRAKVLEMMTQRANNRAKVKMFSRLVDYLVENNRVDVPPSMIDWYLDRLLEDARKSQKNIDEEKFRENYRGAAIKNMKWHLLRKAIIEEHNLAATDENLEQELEMIAEKEGSDIKVLKSHFKQERNRNRLKDDIEERRVLDLLETLAKITEKKINYKDFIAQDY